MVCLFAALLFHNCDLLCKQRKLLARQKSQFHPAKEVVHVMSESARNCCAALNPHKAIALPTPPQGLVQIAVSTLLPMGEAVTAHLRTRGTFDTALEIWHQLKKTACHDLWPRCISVANGHRAI
jgi:hypothetical protein